MVRHPAALTLVLACATLVLGEPALAGGGVRLNFGGPLGTFVATPTPGYGGGSGYTSAKPKAHAAKRAPVYTTERNRPKTVARVVPVRHTVPSNAAETIPVTANEGAAHGLLGRTLALDSLPRAETVHALPPSETIVATDGGEAQTTAAATAPSTKPAPKVTVAEGPATCRKFIPAVGVTVTVACD